MAVPIVLDFESYYAPRDKYSLRSMSIEGYVLDDRFQVHGCTVIDEDLCEFLPLPEFKLYLKSRKDWERRAVISHNARFDMSILCWRYKVIPGAYIDTMSIANAFIMPHTGSVSLDNCCKYLGLPQKDKRALNGCANLRTDEIMHVPGLWSALAEYAVLDGKRALDIFHYYWRSMAPTERLIMDWTIRNYVRGRLRLDTVLLRKNLENETVERQDLLRQLGLDRPDTLRSTKAFADKLATLGVNIEYKSNPKGEEIPAFAKDDDFMRKHLNSPDPIVQTAIRGRLAFQSNIEVTRTKRLIEMAEITGDKMLVPLNYHAAHTGRFGGAESINVQNLKKKSLIRQAIQAPKGQVLVSADASQIEARLVGWLAGCKLIVDAFREGRDLYCEFASNLFGFPVTKAEEMERQTGKVSILQLGYQSGAAKLQKKLEGSGVVVTLLEARLYVKTYRHLYHEIPHMWWAAEAVMRECLRDGKSRVFILDQLWFTPEGIKLPSNRWISYPQLCESEEPGQMLYYSARYKTWTDLYGGKIIENIIQAMARDIVIDVQVRYLADTVLQAHDEIVQLVPEHLAQARLAETIEALSYPPDWCHHPKMGYPPLAAEGYISTCYAPPPPSSAPTN